MKPMKRDFCTAISSVGPSHRVQQLTQQESLGPGSTNRFIGTLSVSWLCVLPLPCGGIRIDHSLGAYREPLSSNATVFQLCSNVIWETGTDHATAIVWLGEENCLGNPIFATILRSVRNPQIVVLILLILTTILLFPIQFRLLLVFLNFRTRVSLSF